MFHDQVTHIKWVIGHDSSLLLLRICQMHRRVQMAYKSGGEWNYFQKSWLSIGIWHFPVSDFFTFFTICFFLSICGQNFIANTNTFCDFFFRYFKFILVAVFAFTKKRPMLRTNGTVRLVQSPLTFLSMIRDRRSLT